MPASSKRQVNNETTGHVADALNRAGLDTPAFPSPAWLDALCQQYQSAEARAISLVSARASEVIFLTLLVSCAFLLRIWGISHLHIWDENVYLLNAEVIFSGHAPYNEISSRPPLLPLLFAAVFHLWHRDYAAWIVTIVLNALGPLFLYLAGRRFVGRLPAALASLLLVFTPFMLSVFPPQSTGFVSDYTGHSLMTDCPALTLILLAFWLLLRALEKQTAFRFTIAGVALAATVLMRFGSLSSVGILALLTLASKRRVRGLIFCISGFLIGVAPYLLWSRLRYGGFLASFLDGWANFDGPAESPLYYLAYAPIIFSWLAVAGLLLWGLPWIQALWTGEARSPVLTGFDPGIPISPNWRQAFLLFWAVALTVCFSSLSHKEPRYIIPAEAPIFLLAGIGLSAALQTPRIPARAIGVTILAAAMLCTYWPDHQRFAEGFVSHEVSDEMRVSEYIRQHVPSNATLYTNGSYPDFAYYSDHFTLPLPDDGQSLYKEFGHLPPGSILIAYKVFDTGVVPEPKLAWLDANPLFTRLREFPTIVLYRRDARASTP